MPSHSKDSEIDLMRQLLSEAYEKKTWHGPNLRQSIRGVSAPGAAWRPASGRHNIWELTLHAAYWKYAVRRRLLGLPQGSFALRGSNFFAMPEPHADAEWRGARQLLNDEHRKLMAAVFDPRNSRVVKNQLRMIFGVAYHDIYHAGQIRLLRRLQETRSPR
jgi:hypothetical protein